MDRQEPRRRLPVHPRDVIWVPPFPHDFDAKETSQVGNRGQAMQQVLEICGVQEAAPDLNVGFLHRQKAGSHPTDPIAWAVEYASRVPKGTTPRSGLAWTVGAISLMLPNGGGHGGSC